MALYTYDFKKVIMTINGVPMSGFSDTAAITVAYDEDAFTKVVGADGQTTRSKSNNFSGTITLTLKQTSPSNDVLSALAALDRLSGTGVAAVIVKEIGGTTIYGTATGWVRKLADSEFAMVAADREWIIDTAEMTGFVGGIPAFGASA